MSTLRRKLLSLVALFCLGLFALPETSLSADPLPLTSHTITITGAATDCWAQSGTSGATQSCTEDVLRVGKNANGERRAFISFDLSAVPVGATVDAATLTLYAQNQTTTNAISVSASQLTRAWTTGVTWATADGISAWSTPGGDFAPPTSVNPAVGATLGAFTWDVTQLVGGWAIESYDNNGVLVYPTPGSTGNNVVSFQSSDPGGGNEPSLTVTYEPPAPPLVCPEVSSNSLFQDARSLCASAATALAINPTTGSQVCSVVPSSVPEVSTLTEPVGEFGVLLGADINLTDAAVCDSLTTASFSGSPETLYYPPGSLVDNYPDGPDYNPHYPIGTLVIPGAAFMEETNALGSTGATSAATGNISTTGMKFFRTVVVQAESTKDKCNSHKEICVTSFYRFYHVTAEDDSQHNYIVIAAHSSAHGGDGFHYLDVAADWTKVMNTDAGVSIADVDPSESTVVPTSAETVTATVDLHPSIAGISAGGVSYSDSFTIYKEKTGPITIDIPSLFYYGWTGPGKKCDDNGTAACEYTGSGGAALIKFPTGTTWKTHIQTRACWHNWAGDSHCSWGNAV